MKKRNLFITQAALIAALYVVLTLVSAAFGLDSKAIQFRLSGGTDGASRAHPGGDSGAVHRVPAV